MFRIYSKVVRASGVYIEAHNIGGAVGDHVIIKRGDERLDGEVIGFHEGKCIIMPFGYMAGLKAGDKVWIKGEKVSTSVGEELLGHVVDPLGRSVLDARPLSKRRMPIELESINPMRRERINRVFDVGVRSINALLTLGVGQRVGIFAGAGVGKSTLLGMIAKYSSADVVVLALIGERGREVREFVEDVLAEGIEKSVVVVTTSEQPPILKVKGAISALVHARYFASRGYNVLLLMDSITRLAMAQREVGLSAGEPPTLKGYTPSVFSTMAKIVESCGNFTGGSITGIFSVLVEGDDISLDPVADALMGMLDGHIILSRKRANAGLFPAVDPVRSLSRLMPHIVSQEHVNMALYIKELLSVYEAMEDLVNLGLYKRGSNAVVDKIITHKQEVDVFFRQSFRERDSFADSVEQLKSLYKLMM